MKDQITYDDFAKLDLRIATIIAVEEIEGADKLWKITLDVGEDDESAVSIEESEVGLQDANVESRSIGLGQRTIVAGVKPWYSADQLLGKQVVYLANLEPRVLRGVESHGMLVAAGDEEAVLILPEKEVKNGTALR